MSDLRIPYHSLSIDAYRGLVAAGTALEQSPLGKTLIDFVFLRVSQINGCAFCIDMHWHDLIKLGADPRHVNAVAGWREAPFFSDRERAALRWAELVTNIPHTDPSDEEFARLRTQFSDAEIADLSYVIVVINSWNLLNVSLRNPVPEQA